MHARMQAQVRTLPAPPSQHIHSQLNTRAAAAPMKPKNGAVSCARVGGIQGA